MKTAVSRKNAPPSAHTKHVMYKADCMLTYSTIFGVLLSEYQLLSASEIYITSRISACSISQPVSQSINQSLAHAVYHHYCYYPHMPIGKVRIYRLMFLCVILFDCTVTDISGEDKASSVKFCAVVHRHPGQDITHFGELFMLAQNQTNQPPTRK